MQSEAQTRSDALCVGRWHHVHGLREVLAEKLRVVCRGKKRCRD